MVGLIMRMTWAIRANSMTAQRAGRVALGAGFGLLLAAATIVLASLDIPGPAGGAELLAIVLALWAIGWIIAPAYGGGAPLRAEHFRLLPVPRLKLAVGLLVSALVGLPSVVTLIAFASLVPLAINLPAPAVVVAVPAALLSTVLVVVVGRMSSALFTAISQSRLGAVISATVTSVMIVIAQSAWIVVIAIAIELGSGDVGGASIGLSLLPTTWGIAAVEAAGTGALGTSLLWLAGLAIFIGALFTAWMLLLSKGAMWSPVVRAPARREQVARGGALVAVYRKELRTWLRSAGRVQDLALSLVYAVLTCLVPLTLDSTLLMPFLGVLLAVMGAATASNLYGSDGTALWLTLVMPGTERADVRGRQLAWLTLLGIPAAVLTVVGLLLHADPAVMPWVLAAVTSVIGAGAGLSVYVSARSIVPTRDPHKGKRTPGDQENMLGQSFLVIFLLSLVASPALGTALIGQLLGNTAVLWASVPIGIVSGVLGYWLLGQAAVVSIQTHGPELLSIMRTQRRVAVGPRSETVSHTVTIQGAEAAGKPRPKPSGFTAMTAAEKTRFWILYMVAVLATVPQGIVAGIHLVAGTDVTGWFIALHAPVQWRWPAIICFIVLGVACAGAAVRTLMVARKRASE